MKTRRRWSAAAAALALLLMAVRVPAQAQTPPPSVSLLTFAPGQVYWQRFGHNALLLRDPRTGMTAVYNYGVFDFRTKNFFLNFARGRMLYRLDVEPLRHTRENYAAEGRWIREQVLALDEAQRAQLARFLEWNAQPQNAEYRYDYFLANCSTRVRDAIDRALGGQLKRQLQARQAGHSYRHEVLRLMAPMPALMVGMDLGLGPRVDAPIDGWQDAFIPMRLMEAVRGLSVDDGRGGRRPLVAFEQEILEARSPDPPQRPPALLLPLLAGGVALAALLGFARRRRHRSAAARIGYALLGSALALIAGVTGVVMLLAWLLTDHWAMWDNQNLLLFDPLALLLLPALLRSLRRDTRPGRFARGLSWALAGGAGLALLLKLLPVAAPQQNLHWIAFWLPVQLALALSMRGPASGGDQPAA